MLGSEKCTMARLEIAVLVTYGSSLAKLPKYN